MSRPCAEGTPLVLQVPSHGWSSFSVRHAVSQTTVFAPCCVASHQQEQQYMIYMCLQLKAHFVLSVIFLVVRTNTKSQAKHLLNRETENQITGDKSKSKSYIYCPLTPVWTTAFCCVTWTAVIRERENTAPLSDPTVHKI